METVIREVILQDRVHAGRLLAWRLGYLKRENPVVMALPRGGVVVGFEVASVLDAPLDIIAVRKIGAPTQPEFGIGALVDGDQPELLLDRDRARRLGVTLDDLEQVVRGELAELRRRERLYRGGADRIEVRDRTVIVVDDGIATGSSIRAALRGLRRAQPRRLILAVPVASPATIESLQDLCDEWICLLLPGSFRAVGEFYENFEQTTDEEVIALLQRNRSRFSEAESSARSTPKDGG
jgi:putative phosphoribosyl transferase